MWHRKQGENTGLVSKGHIFEDAHKQKGILSPLKSRGTRKPTQVAQGKSFVHLGKQDTETPSGTYLQKAFAGKTVPPASELRYGRLLLQQVTTSSAASRQHSFLSYSAEGHKSKASFSGLKPR